MVLRFLSDILLALCYDAAILLLRMELLLMSCLSGSMASLVLEVACYILN